MEGGREKVRVGIVNGIMFGSEVAVVSSSSAATFATAVLLYTF
jgi:hypothetical protein